MVLIVDAAHTEDFMHASTNQSTASRIMDCPGEAQEKTVIKLNELLP